MLEAGHERAGRRIERVRTTVHGIIRSGNVYMNFLKGEG